MGNNAGLKSWLFEISNASSGYKVGQQVDVPLASDSNADFTLMVFARSGCSACQSAVPLLRRFVNLDQEFEGLKARLVVPVIDDSELEFAKRVGILSSGVGLAPAAQIRVKAIPTVLIVNHSGEILFEHAGSRPVAERDSILDRARSALRKSYAKTSSTRTAKIG